MSTKVSANAFADAMQSILLDFAEDTKELVRQCANSAGEEAVRYLREKSPKHTGEYAKSWTLKNAVRSSKMLKVTVYNKDHYQLTHLLEDGHARVDGGRTQAYPHIGLAEEVAAETLEEKILLEVGKNK